MRCPAQVIVLCEATKNVEEMLTSPAVAADWSGATGLDGRPTFEHFVVRGNESAAAILIAARKDNCSYLNCIEYVVDFDHPYRSNRKSKTAHTRMLTCKVGFKQNVDHLGKSVTVMGVHGNFKF